MNVAAEGRAPDLKRRLRELVLLPMHDHTDDQSVHLGPALTKGYRSEEDRARIRDDEASVFTPEGRLRTERRPQYIPVDPVTHVGRVPE